MSNTKVQIRQDTAANWTDKNPRLLQGEFGLETDGGGLGPRKKKLGDGVLFWNDLPYEVAMTDIDNGWQLDGNTVGAIKKFGTIDDFDIPIIINDEEIARWIRGTSTIVALDLGVAATRGANLQLHTTVSATPWLSADESNGVKIRDFYTLGLGGNVVSMNVYNNMAASIYAATANSQVAIITKQGIGIGHITSGTFADSDAVSGVALDLGETNLSVRNAVTIPTTEYIDGFLLYSADRTGAGTASPFILTENGTLIDLVGLALGGGSIPAGTIGQTLYYAAAGTTVTATSNLYNDGTKIGIGGTPAFLLDVIDTGVSHLSIAPFVSYFMGDSAAHYDLLIDPPGGITRLRGGGVDIVMQSGAISLAGDTVISGKLTVTGAIDPTHLYLDEQAGDPANVANKGILYTKDVGALTQLFYMDSAGTVKNISATGTGDALTANPLSQFAATTSLQLKGVISDETGSGALVFGTTPSFTTSMNLSSGFVFDFNAGDVLLTHSANTLAVSGTTSVSMNSNLVIGGTTLAASATAALHLYNGTIPSGNITDGFTMYAADFGGTSMPHWRGENGNITRMFTSSGVLANVGDLITSFVQHGFYASSAFVSVPTTEGGTGLVSNVVGDILIGDATGNPLVRLADVATGNALLSGGVGAAPAYGKVGLTTHVSGVLPIANGGTNKAITLVNGGVVWTDADSMEVSAAGTAGQMLQSNGASAPTWVEIPIGQLVHATGNGNTVAASTTAYAQFFFGNSFSASEAGRQIEIVNACTIKNLYVRTNATQSATGNMVVTIRKDTGGGGANTTLTITIAAGAGAGLFTDLVNSFTCAAGDKVSVQCVNNATATSTGILVAICGMYKP